MCILTSLPLIRVAQVTVAGSSQQSITIGSIASIIPSGTKHLVLELNAAHTYTERRFCEVRLNGNSQTIYDRREFSATDSTVTTKYRLDQGLAQGVDIPPANENQYGGGYLFFPYAFRTDNLKIWQTMGSSLETRLQRHVGVWENTSAIDSITLRPWQGVQGRMSGLSERL